MIESHIPLLVELEANSVTSFISYMVAKRFMRNLVSVMNSYHLERLDKIDVNDDSSEVDQASVFTYEKEEQLAITDHDDNDGD